jgi:hypothetical protein
MEQEKPSPFWRWRGVWYLRRPRSGLPLWWRQDEAAQSFSHHRRDLGISGWPPPWTWKPGLFPPRLEHGGASEDGVRQGPGRHPTDVCVPHWTFMVQRLLTWQSLLGCASGRSLALLKMAAGRRQTTKLASVPTTTPKPRTPLKGCSLSLLSLKHALAVGHLQPLRLGNSSSVPSLVALVNLSPFWRNGCNKPWFWLFAAGERSSGPSKSWGRYFSNNFFGIALVCLSLRPICWMLPALSLPPQPAELSPRCLFLLPFDSQSESRWRAILGLMSRLFAFLAHVQAVQPVAGPFFCSLVFG